METCDRLGGCGFLRKYRDRHVMAYAKPIEEYCNDPEKSRSNARKKIFGGTGAAPPDGVLPSGANVNDIG